MNIIGNIEGKTAILIDDIIDTAGTITLAETLLLRTVLLKYMLAVHTQYYLVQQLSVFKIQILKS